VFTLRPWMVPDDYPAVLSIFNQVNHEPTTVDALMEDDRRFPADGLRLRLVAEDRSGCVVAYGLARRFPYAPAGLFLVRVLTAPATRRQGAASALLGPLEQYALDHGAMSLQTWVWDNDSASLDYARKWGYTETMRHYFRSTLDLTTFDDAAYDGHIAGLEAAGLRFATMADMPGEATERALYELDRQASADNPGEDLPDFLPYDEWRKYVTARPNSTPDLFIFAMDGDRIVAMTDLFHLKQTGAMNTGFTGVDREYRGRGLALALKVLAARTARRYGAPYLRTENDSRNGPMLAVNRRLGYVPQPGSFTLRKQVTP